MVTTAPAVAKDRMLAHNFEVEGSHDHVTLVVSSGNAAWTNSELQEVSSAGIATRDTAPIVVVVEVVLEVDVVVEVVVVETVVEEEVNVLMVVEEVVNVLTVLVKVHVVNELEEVAVVVAVVDDEADSLDTLVVLVMLSVVVVDVTVSVTLSITGALRASTVTA